MVRPKQAMWMKISVKLKQDHRVGGNIFNLGELRHNNTSRLAEKKSFLGV